MKKFCNFLDDLCLLLFIISFGTFITCAVCSHSTSSIELFLCSIIGMFISYILMRIFDRLSNLYSCDLNKTKKLKIAIALPIGLILIVMSVILAELTPFTSGFSSLEIICFIIGLVFIGIFYSNSLLPIL